MPLSRPDRPPLAKRDNFGNLLSALKKAQGRFLQLARAKKESIESVPGEEKNFLTIINTLDKDTILASDQQEVWLAIAAYYQYLDKAYSEAPFREFQAKRDELIAAISKLLAGSGLSIADLRQLRQWEQRSGLDLEELKKYTKLFYQERIIRFYLETISCHYQLDYNPFEPQLEWWSAQLRTQNSLERNKFWENFRAKLLLQAEGLAHIRVELLNKLRLNPGLEPKEVADWLYQQASKYNLSRWQLSKIREGIEEYWRRRADLKSFLASHRNHDNSLNQQAIFKACFNFSPQGKIKVEERPLGLCFYFFNPQDYAYVHSGAFRGEKVTPEQMERCATVLGGVISFSTDIEVVIINKSAVEGEEEFSSVSKGVSLIIAHEEQHIFDKLVNPRLCPPDLEKYFRSSDNQRQALEYYFLEILKSNILPQLQEEIFALLAEGMEINDLQAMILGKEASYHFGRQWWSQQANKLKRNKSINLTSHELEELARKVLFQSYDLFAKKALRAIRALKDKGWDNKKIINYLAYFPLPQWWWACRLVE
ncbi:hypothetical protein D6821_01720 [Candidatus Parcubacteria bacterium]|nr:MAG: hypothetical protein D6821_01720 [Candidatus Parcubacteria bacterium]